jgi:hypothetical protein
MEGRSNLLEGFAAFHRNVDEGQPDFLLVPEADGGVPARARMEALLTHLEAQGIRFEVATSAFEARATPHPGWELRTRFPTGTVRVPARQPRGLLAVTLLQAETVLDATYSYDISAWSLPFGYGVEAHAVTQEIDAGWRPREQAASAPAPSGEPYGYLVKPGFDAWPGLVAFLDAGGRGRVMPDTFRVGQTAYPRGTLFLPRGLNSDLDGRVAAAGLAGRVEAVRSAVTTTGPDLGTGGAGDLALPRVVLVGGEGTSSASFGAHRFFLHHRLGLAHDAVNVDDLAGMDLSNVDVVVVPEAGGLARALGDGGMARLEDWVRAGGTVVAVGSGAEALAELADVEVRRRAGPDEAERLERALRTREQRQLERWESQTPGTILEVSLDVGHPLAFGAGTADQDDRMFVLSTGVGFEPSESFETAAYFPEDTDGVSGVIGESTVDRLRRSSWLVERRLGRGSLILFADDPLFRIMWYAGFQPYANALLLGPAF